MSAKPHIIQPTAILSQAASTALVHAITSVQLTDSRREKLQAFAEEARAAFRRPVATKKATNYVRPTGK
jgi:hypothetical protein